MNRQTAVRLCLPALVTVGLAGRPVRGQPVAGPKTLVYITEGLVIDRDIGQVSWAAEATAAAIASIYALRVVPSEADVLRRRTRPPE